MLYPTIVLQLKCKYLVIKNKQSQLHHYINMTDGSVQTCQLLLSAILCKNIRLMKECI